MFPITIAAKATGLTVPAILNYIHRRIVVHCGRSPLSGKPRDLPMLGIYELTWIGALRSQGIPPELSSTLFQVLQRKEPSVISDRTEDEPFYAAFGDTDPLDLRLLRGKPYPNYADLMDEGAKVVTIVNLSALFGGVDAALHRACH